MDTNDPMLTKVRKLLAQAEDPAATPAEAQAFTAKATQLIADYGIDQALLSQRDPLHDPVGDRVITLDAPYAREKASLASSIAHALRCEAVLRQQRTFEGSDFSLHVFGHDSDLVCVEILFTSLLLQGTRELMATPVPSYEHAAAFRRTWWLGFASAIGSRLAESEERSARAAEPRFAASGTSAALVLADRSEIAARAMRAAYPRLRASATRQLSGGGAEDGWASGQRADLGLGARVGRRARGEVAG